MAVQARGERSRTAALNAAIAILTDSGYAALTTRAVQQASGLSRGSFLHHFPTREDLLAATIEELIERRAQRAQRMIERFAVDPPADRLTAAIAAVRELCSGPDFLAEMELWASARTNPDFRETLIPVTDRIAKRLRDQLTELFGPEIATDPEFPTLAMLTVEIARGLAFSAPTRRGRGDTVMLDYWARAATAMLNRPVG
ncbi:TetR/AcrR family transcriptional regulator [Nocardia sp. NPDC056100]|uniref:TetR/AcrR family transcriptional regulator n=1 Tax=Nocardia sp. NPDC056100 TaxID=3345712 RepID=UPI0035DA0B39